MIADQNTRQIVCTEVGNGRKHDYKLYKQSQTPIHPTITAEVDTGYQGLQKAHPNTEIPKKRSKKIRLPKQINKETNGYPPQVAIENIIRKLKIFRILAENSNRRRRFKLRLNLIAAIANLLTKPI
ncbi:MAG: transposase [Bacteroidetes bacterium]|nr:transposase [Bacteroidota bacterium]